jgi:hypothetical protein
VGAAAFLALMFGRGGRVMPAIASWRATTSSRRSIADPAAEPGSDAATYPAFERTAAELEARIRFLILWGA